MTGLIARILLRYLASALVVKGILDPSLGEEVINDPQVAMAIEVGIGLLVGALSEAWMVYVTPSPTALKAADAVDAGKAVTIEAQPKEVLKT